MARISVPLLLKMKQERQKIVALTAYDATFARVLERAGVDVVLVGDSLGMVVQGHESTLPVRLQDMIYHVGCVARGLTRSLLMADLSFGSYETSPEQAFTSAARLLAAGAHMVKLEGGAFQADTVRFLVTRGVPVCAHIGLTPQHVREFGGYRIQGRTPAAARQLLEDARVLEQCGAQALVLEAVPGSLAAEISAALRIPTIGIGAGAACDGQVLVLYDLLGADPAFKPRFVHNFLEGATGLQDAVARYAQAVRSGTFPGDAHTFSA